MTTNKEYNGILTYTPLPQLTPNSGLIYTQPLKTRKNWRFVKQPEADETGKFWQQMLYK